MKLYTNEALLQSLRAQLRVAPEQIAHVAQILADDLGVAWKPGMLNVLAQYAYVSFAGPVYAWRVELRKRAAARSGLDCAWDTASSELKDVQRLARTMIESQTRASESALLGFGGDIWKHLLRSGAILQTELGAVASEHAENILEDYCSVYAENAEELDFCQAVSKAQQTAFELENRLTELVQLLPASALKGLQSLNLSHFYSNQFLLDSGVPLANDAAAAQIIIRVFEPRRKRRSPAYYNNVGTVNLGPVQVYELTGWRPVPTAALRSKYPGLFKGVPYRGAALDDPIPGPVDSAVKQPGKRKFWR